MKCWYLLPTAVTSIDSQIRTYRKITGVPRYVPWLPKEVPGDYQTEVTDPTIEEEKLVTGMFRGNSQLRQLYWVANLFSY